MGVYKTIKNPEIRIQKSKSVCPVCLQTIDCNIISRNGKVFLQKTCAEHGDFETILFSDSDSYIKAIKENVPGTKPKFIQTKVSKGCPNDCGFCDEHQQHTCVGIIEITDVCNLHCPVCFAASESSFSLPLVKVKEMIDIFVEREDNPEVLQISGGEPTLHPDILEILEYAGKKGILYPVLNTNGIKLADPQFAKQVASTVPEDRSSVGKPVIYFQFDGFSNAIYETLRGKPLLETKMKAFENCKKEGMTVALVCTLVKGINDHEIGRIIDFAMNESYIKMVNFQPATLAGRHDLPDKQDGRMTIPDVISEVEIQTKGTLKKDSFITTPCPYPTCSVCAYVYSNNGRDVVLTRFLNSAACRDYLVGRAIPDIEVVARIEKSLTTFGSLLSRSSILSGNSHDDCCCSGNCSGIIAEIGSVLDNVTLVSIHAFMDEHNFSVERTRKCCITEIMPDGRMIPFCSYNILYRKELAEQFRNDTYSLFDA
ncbi:putative radical SAM superfamily Fe-S cluster-containing enzyme [Methanohalophilus levihalophilus]|uniref:radical SAM protein n=1 Tax=Methanohalophilus levihalophilus TaxID=1431282 RepID=UPI001AE43C93|nr:radical SAM protein [Methanohalophilus levihalophilus]MBP2029109.1 putative radical SAM superfamily Fe-S cluster-containing enzyme [Methanohalophilus levihalophilus]